MPRFQRRAYKRGGSFIKSNDKEINDRFSFLLPHRQVNVSRSIVKASSRIQKSGKVFIPNCMKIKMQHLAFDISIGLIERDEENCWHISEGPLLGEA